MMDTPQPSPSATGAPSSRTVIAAVIDKSGSMHALTGDVIGGFNHFLEEQQKQPSDAIMHVTLFDTDVVTHARNAKLVDVRPLDTKSYQAHGNTALLDAVGNTLKALQSETTPSDTVIVCIITDGHENSSRYFDRERVRSMIEEARRQGWNIVYLGADASAWDAASSMGVSTASTGMYAASAAGYGNMMRNFTSNATLIRAAAASGQSVSTDSLNWTTGEEKSPNG